MRKIQRSTHDDDDDDTDRSHQSLDHIPHDLIAEILSRLPTKSILRSRSVSKLWSSITTTPDFINSFASRSLASAQPCVLLIFSKLDQLFVFSSPIHQNNTHPPPPPDQTESYQFTIPNNGLLHRHGSVHGLIYFDTSTQLMIWNPTLKRIITFPELQGSEGKYKTTLLGYDPVDRKYKALCIFRGYKNGILTLGAQESWRMLPKDDFPLHYCVSEGCVICINGVIYYTVILNVYDSNDFSEEHGVMSFDLQSEKFRFIKYPMENHKSLSFVSYERRLALMIGSNGRSSTELWILEDAENHQWEYKQFPPPQLPYIIWILRGLRLKGVTDAGEFIYVSTPYDTNDIRSPSHINDEERSSYERFDILYFDPKKNSSRQVKLRGIGFDDFERLELYEYDFMKDLTVVPRHIESLMSL
ncbi:unnamed protein product [Microthlaspi erraticum]|uniref:F-box domain-containing protein n=1 Tax=Microthlaspi erraticum TaxID=1685480 RepID=A0A6D2LCU7_9BRAS|nr:unnamed protein product [Microthlaspi erraticum]